MELKKLFRSTLLLAAGCLMYTGCSDKDDPIPEPALSVNPTSLIVTSVEGSATFSITCNQAWSITKTDAWILEVTPNSGTDGVDNQTITVKYDANTGDVRNATIKVTCGTKTENVTVSQASALAAPVLANVYLMKLTLQEDPAGFNMLTNGGFEDYPNEAINFRSNWWLEESKYSTDAHSGTHSITFGRDHDNFGNLCIQDLPVIKNVTYVQSAWLKSNQDDSRTNTYVGTRKGIEGEPILRDVGFPFTTSWSLASLEFTPTDVTKAVAFVGCFFWSGLTLNVDDMCIKPKDVNQKSYTKASISKVGSILESYGNDLTSADGCVMWNGGNGTTMIAFGENMQAGAMTPRGSAVATSSDNTLSDGLTSSLVKSGDAPVVPLTPAGGTEVACTPTGGFNVGTRQYMYYMSVKTKAFGDDTWEVNKSSFAYSDDNGATWTKSSTDWSATSNFVQASFIVKDGYVYMYGTKAGRSERGVYLARVATANVLTKASWEYWNGESWTASDDTKATSIASAQAGEITVAYNATHGRYMMAYFSPLRQAIVYRDARAPQGEWSGEKLIYVDDASGLYSASIHPVSDGNDIYFIVSSAWGMN